MTDPHPPPSDSDPLDPRDELASAHLDGATGPDDAARVAADPELASRVDRFAATRDALRRATDDEPVDEARREAAIVAALAAFAEPDPSVDADARALETAPALLVRPRRGRSRTRTLQLVGIAAAAALIALTMPLLDHLGSDDSDDTATSSFEATGRSLAPSAEADASAGGGADGAASDAAGGAGAFDASSGSELGAFADLAALRTAVRDQLGPKASSSTAPSPAHATAGTESAPACAPTAEPDVVYTARATVAGRPVTVVVREDGSGQRTLVVLDAACGLVSEEPL